MLLKIEPALARHSGHDLLSEMSIDVHVKLVERHGTLHRMISEFRELADQMGLAQDFEVCETSQVRD